MAIAVHVARGKPRSGLEATAQQRRCERIAAHHVGPDPHVVHRHHGTLPRRIADQVEGQRRFGARRQRRDIERHRAAIPNHARRPRRVAARLGIEKRRRLRPERGHQRLAGLAAQRHLECVRQTAARRGLQPQAHQRERDRLRRRRNRERLLQRGQKGILLPQLGHPAQARHAALDRRSHCPAVHPRYVHTRCVHPRCHSPVRQPGREIPVADRTDRQRIVVLPQQRQAIAAADRQIQIAVGIEVRGGQSLNHPQPADRGRRLQLEPAIVQACQKRHRAIAMPDGQIRQRRSQELAHDHRDRLVPAAAIPNRRAQHPAARATAAPTPKHRHFIRARQHGDHVGSEIRVGQGHHQAHTATVGGNQRSRLARSPGFQRCEPSVPIPAGHRNSLAMLDHRIQHRVAVEQPESQSVHRASRVQSQIADQQSAPAAIPAVECHRQPPVVAQRHQIRPSIVIQPPDLDRDRRHLHRQRLIRQRRKRQHPTFFQAFRRRRPRPPLPPGSSASDSRPAPPPQPARIPRHTAPAFPSLIKPLRSWIEKKDTR